MTELKIGYHTGTLTLSIKRGNNGKIQLEPAAFWFPARYLLSKDTITLLFLALDFTPEKVKLHKEKPVCAGLEKRKGLAEMTSAWIRPGLPDTNDYKAQFSKRY